MQSRLGKFEGYLLIPHELLHIAGYRLVGKRCVYHWGEPYVIPVGPLTRRQRLVGILFPFVVCTVLFWLLTFLSGVILMIVSHRQGNLLLWLIPLFSLCMVAGAYAGTSLSDLRKAYCLIRNKPQDSKTPFDFFLAWPTDSHPRWVPLLALGLSALAAVALFLTF